MLHFSLVRTLPIANYVMYNYIIIYNNMKYKIHEIVQALVKDKNVNIEEKIMLNVFF